MRKLLSVLFSLVCILNIHAQVQGQGCWVVGSLVNAIGTTNIPQKYVRFIPPPGTPLAIGTNTALPQIAQAPIVGGNFSAWLVGPYLYTADFGTVPGQGPVTVPILVWNNSNTLPFNVAAQLAINSKMFPGTNITVVINTNINNGTNYSIFAVTNGINVYAGNAGILVTTNFGTNVAVSTTFLMSDVTNAIFPNARLANSTNVFMTNGTLVGTWTVSSLSVASGTGAFAGTFNGAHQGDGSLLINVPFATNSIWATNLAGVAPSASNVLNVVGWTNLPSNVLSNQQAGVTFSTTPSAQLTLTNSGTARAAQLVATNIGAATQGILVSSGSGGPAALAASEFVGNLTGVATQATHTTNADVATTANAVPWTGITGAPSLATNTYVGISNALGFAPATNGSSTSVAWTSITGTPNLATNTYVGISNAVGFVLATNGSVITISQVSNPNWATNSNAGVTNALGYIPLTNGAYGVTNALGFIPPPNTYVGISNALNFVAATNGGPINNGQIPSGVVTNNDIGRNLTFFSPLLIGNAGFTAEFQPGAPIQFQGSAVTIDTGGNYTASGSSVTAAFFYGNGSNLTKLNGSNVLAGTVPNTALQFTAATNSYAGITGALGFIPPASNYLSISNILGFQPATNGLVTATNAIGITSGSTGTNPVLFANPSGVSMTWTNPSIPAGIEPRVVGISGLNIRASGNVDNVTVSANKYFSTGSPGFTGDGSGLNNVAAQSLASGALVNNPIVTGGTFNNPTLFNATISGVALATTNAMSITNNNLLVTNSLNLSFRNLDSNGMYQSVTLFGTTNNYGTNGLFTIQQTNGNYLVASNGGLQLSGTITATNGVYGVFTGNAAGLTNTATDNEIYLYTNKTFVYRGTLYSYPASTTACIQELQQQLAQVQPTQPNSFSIKLAQNSIYPFSSQIYVSNSCNIEGAGMEGSVFMYVGPTNLWTYQMMTNLWDLSDVNRRHAERMGLFNFVTNNVPGATEAHWAVSPTYKNFSIWAPTNFPCYLTTFQCGNATLDHFGFFGPRVFSSGEAGTLSPLKPVFISGQQMVIASFMCPFQQLTVKDCWTQDMAAGFDLFGNAYYHFEDNSFYDISCNTANSGTNIYYPASKLGVGYAHRLGTDVWTCSLKNENTYNCKVSYYFDGATATKIYDTKDQGFTSDGGKCTVAFDSFNGGAAGVMGEWSDFVGGNGFPLVGFVTNGSGGFFTVANGDGAAFSSVLTAYTNAIGSVTVLPMILFDTFNFSAGGGGVIVADAAYSTPSGPASLVSMTGLGVKATAYFGTNSSGPGIYFSSNNIAAAGSIFSDPVGGVVYTRSNSAWYKLGIAASPGR